jgi:hypothetical protein
MSSIQVLAVGMGAGFALGAVSGLFGGGSAVASTFSGMVLGLLVVALFLL